MAFLKPVPDAPAEPISDETAASIDRIVEYAFWQLMLADDFDQAERDIRLLVAGINLRWARVRVAAQTAVLEI